MSEQYPHQDALNKMLAEMSGEPPTTNGHTPLATVAEGTPPMTDGEVINLCRGDRNAPKFVDLYDHGDISAYNNNDSDADFALINLLYFNTQDPEQIDRIMRGSALARPKYDRNTAGKTYLRYSIDEAIARNTKEGRETRKPRGEVITPGRPKPTGTGTGTVIYSGTGTGIPDGTKNSTDATERGRRVRAFRDIEEPGPRRYLIAGTVPEDYPTMVHGDGGTAKSMLALSMGLAIANESPLWLGHVVMGGPVLYLDFELDEKEQSRRVRQLCRAEGFSEPPENMYYMSALGMRTRDAFAEALQGCKELEIRLLIIDSLGPALQGDAEAAKDVIGFHNDVIDPFRLAGTAVLVIDHQSKMQGGERYQNKSAFGSVFKGNLARSVLQVQPGHREDGELHVTIRQKKHNFGPLAKPFGARLNFKEDMVRIERVELEEDALAEEGTLNAHERVKLAVIGLEEANRNEVHEKMPDLSAGTVKKEMSKLVKDGLAEWIPDEMRNKQPVLRWIGGTGPTGTGTRHYKGTGTASEMDPNQDTLEGLPADAGDEERIEHFLADPPEWFVTQALLVALDDGYLTDHKLKPLSNSVASEVFGTVHRRADIIPQVRKKLEQIRGE